MLPPPITRPTRGAGARRRRRLRRRGDPPYRSRSRIPCSPASASPESLSRTRGYFRSACGRHVVGAAYSSPELDSARTGGPECSRPSWPTLPSPDRRSSSSARAPTPGASARRPCRTPATLPSTIFSIMCSGLPLGLHLLDEDATLATRPSPAGPDPCRPRSARRRRCARRCTCRAAGSPRCARRSPSRSSAPPARRSCRCGGCSCAITPSLVCAPGALLGLRRALRAEQLDRLVDVAARSPRAPSCNPSCRRRCARAARQRPSR